MKDIHKDIEQVVDRLAASTRSPQGRFSMEATRLLLDRRIAARRRRKFLRLVSAAAAVVVLGVLAWSTYGYMAPAGRVTVSTLAETRTVRLPDGTQVMLNRYTTITYPDRFKERNREVSLQGEAYFAVTKDREYPFIVQTGALDVRVLGTEFSVEAYPEDELVKATLYKGSVAVDVEDNSPLVLVPGESAVYHKVAGLLSKADVSHPDDEVAWKSGALVFSRTPLKEIARELSNTFNVRIVLDDGLPGGLKLTGRFAYAETLDGILALLQEAGQFNIRKESPTLYVLSK